MRQKVVITISVAGVVFVTGLAYLIDARQKSRDKGITIAAEEGDFAEVVHLLDQGANPNGRHFPNADGWCPYPYRPPLYYAVKAMDTAAFRSNQVLIDLLVDHGGKYTVQEAAALGRIEDVQKMILSDPSGQSATTHQVSLRSWSKLEQMQQRELIQARLPSKWLAAKVMTK